MDAIGCDKKCPLGGSTWLFGGRVNELEDELVLGFVPCANRGSGMDRFALVFGTCRFLSDVGWPYRLPVFGGLENG